MYTITQDQYDNIISALGEIPAKYSYNLLVLFSQLSSSEVEEKDKKE